MLYLIPVTSASVSRKPEMLAALGQVWSFIDWFHPDTERSGPWQDALFEAIPKVSNDLSDEGFADVLEKLLDHLDDPSTRLWKESRVKPNFNDLREGLPSLDDERDGVSIVRINDPFVFASDPDQVSNRLSTIAANLLDKPKIAFDLRFSERPLDMLAVGNLLDQSELFCDLIAAPLTAPQRILRHYHGLKPSSGTSSGGYCKFRKPYEGRTFKPSMRSRCEKRVTFLINENSPLPSLAVPMQFAGSACIVADRAYRSVGDTTVELCISGIGTVCVRLSEFGSYNTSLGGFRVNEVVDANALERAFELVQSRSPFQSPYSIRAEERGNRSLSKRAFPSLENRLLAGYRIWLVFSFFFPYVDLMDKNPDDILLSYISALENSKNAQEYALTVARMVSHASDSHVGVHGEALQKYKGLAAPPILCRMIEGRPVVTWIGPGADHSDMQVGDVILSIDGESVDAGMERLKQFDSSSTLQHRNLKLLHAILRGELNSEISIEFERDDVKGRAVFQRRSLASWSDFKEPGRGETVRFVSEHIGYADLARLTCAQVAPMFEKFRHTKGIIFDMRGYPNGTAWEIAPRLLSPGLAGSVERTGRFKSSSVPAALISCPLNPDPQGQEFPHWREYVQKLRWSDEWKYMGKTVLLIDERAVSQAEHTGLFLKAANGTTFIGSPTAGANGDVTNFSLPGGLRVILTGQSIKYPDGKRLQRVGLIPDIECRPTITGIRNGVDEVLNRAIEFLNDSKV